ncbi:NERD domain-containing protein [Desulforhopalus vacuolatus]|uniref:NERD domain-containing protein n=1 Tax=Desulforhopalus vacuolatus TaxID=40414 RepID=UPI001963F8DD|nr:NERD domain-containing protein [Desulforhopalus vacuolatus]MBM9519086.1 NERD domain-containing protein [Desulforhopalus vacuolatus]
MNLTLSSTFISPLVAPLIAVGLIVVPAVLLLKLFKLSTRKRKSPLSNDLLRNPGQSLLEKINELTVEITAQTLMIPIIFLQIVSLYLLQILNCPECNRFMLILVLLLCGSGFFIYIIINSYRKFHQRNTLRLGYECEVATGQDLTTLITFGFNIFHDFPADGFNIDHIAIGPTGVFAIETKGRAKPLDSKDKPGYKLTFDGEHLQFPSWTERKPLEQARRQAEWLSKWIASSTGTPQPVVPVLSFPGWFISRTKSSDIVIYSGKNCAFLAKGRQVLSVERIKAISYQVERVCRDVKQRSYKKD